MKKEQSGVPRSSTTTTSCAFIFDRPSNGILSIYRDAVVFTVIAAGTGSTDEEVEGASMTRKDGVGDAGMDKSGGGC